MNEIITGTSPGQVVHQTPEHHSGQGRGGFVLREFAPGWGAAVMGTSALSVAMLVAGEGTALGAATTLVARLVLALAAALGAVVLGVTLTRWVRHRDAALADLHHPVKGGMTATAAGALLTLAVAIGKVGPGLLPAALTNSPVIALAGLGAVLALLVGWEFLAEMFSSPRASLAQVSGAWFVPPVVVIIIPLALLPVLGAHPGSAANILALSWASLGIGAVLYLVVTAALFVASISHPLPPAGLAPTLLIGMGPAGLIGLDILRLAQASVTAGVAQPALISALLPLSTMIWGFGLWWLVASLAVLRRGYTKLPFTLSWWGFVFPLAAWTTATVAIGRAWDSGLLLTLGYAATAALTALWLLVLGRTLSGVRDATIWGH